MPETIPCGECQAPLLPGDSRFLTCPHCHTTLELAFIRTKELSDSNRLHSLELRQQLLIHEQNWQEAQRLMMIDTKRGPRLPSEEQVRMKTIINGIFFSIIIAAFAVEEPLALVLVIPLLTALTGGWF